MSSIAQYYKQKLDATTLEKYYDSCYIRIDRIAWDDARHPVNRARRVRWHFKKHPELAVGIDVEARVDGTWVHELDLWVGYSRFDTWVHVGERVSRPTENEAIRNLRLYYERLNRQRKGRRVYEVA